MLDLDAFDIEEIATALADQTDYEQRWLIDPRTGQVAFWTSDTGIDGENPVEIDELDLTGCVLIGDACCPIWRNPAVSHSPRIGPGALLARPVGGGLRAILAADGTEPPAAVLGRVHVDAVASVGIARPQSASEIATEGQGDTGGAAGHPSGGERVVRPVEVHLPPAPGLGVELRSRSRVDKLAVDGGGSRGEVALANGVESEAHLAGEAGQDLRVAGGDTRRSPPVATKRSGSRTVEILASRCDAGTTPSMPGRQLVDEARRDLDQHQNVTIEQHLTSYLVIPTLAATCH